MARSDRTENRKMRNRQEVMRVPEMGYYLVVTDTEATERCYFEGLQDSLPGEVKQKLVIKVVETKTQKLRQHRTIRQADSARDFSSSQGLKSEGILYVFRTFQTAELAEKIR